MKYAFILGRNPEISLAELGSFFGLSLRTELSLRAQRSNLVFLEDSLPNSPQEFLNRLGGTKQIAEIFAEVRTAEIEKTILEFLKKQYGGKGKLTFALSIFPETKSHALLQHLLLALKKNLKAQGISANFLNKGMTNASDVAVAKQGLLMSKTNICIFELVEGKIRLGFSVAMQNFESYAKRDFEKPFRDPAVGMLPPKLAQIMINFACHAEPDCHAEPVEARQKFILDPFCGTGTILVEAMLMGYSVIGSDKEMRLVAGAQQNVEWLRKNFKIPNTVTAEISQKDATSVMLSLSKHDEAKQSFQGGSHVLAVVTEPYLGPPLSRFPAPAYLEKLILELENLYVRFFENAKKWLPKGTQVIFIFPYFRKSPTEKIRLASCIAKIESLGYSKTAFVPLQTDSLFYDRPDQITGREIVRFVKT